MTSTKLPNNRIPYKNEVLDFWKQNLNNGFDLSYDPDCRLFKAGEQFFPDNLSQIDYDEQRLYGMTIYNECAVFPIYGDIENAHIKIVDDKIIVWSRRKLFKEEKEEDWSASKLPGLALLPLESLAVLDLASGPKTLKVDFEKPLSRKQGFLYIPLVPGAIKSVGASA